MKGSHVHADDGSVDVRTARAWYSFDFCHQVELGAIDSKSIASSPMACTSEAHQQLQPSESIYGTGSARGLPWGSAGTGAKRPFSRHAARSAVFLKRWRHSNFLRVGAVCCHVVHLGARFSPSVLKCTEGLRFGEPTPRVAWRGSR